jgi:ethanolamine utilization protein EutM
MASKAIGLLETRGLTALVTGVDAMLKSANVTLAGPMKQVGNALCTAVVIGDVAAVKAATDAGAQAARTVGEVVSVHVIPRPHDDVSVVLPKAPPNTLKLRPLGGGDQTIATLFWPLEGEQVKPASFALPDPAVSGSQSSALLLRDALLLKLPPVRGHSAASATWPWSPGHTNLCRC